MHRLVNSGPRVYWLFFAFLIVSAGFAGGQALPVEPSREAGAAITGAFEGWFKNPDGTFSFLVGYYNRNRRQIVDLPIGPENRIEPGGPDRGQPTHFMPGRNWGLFTITVPADFGQNKLTWTLVANGKTTVIPLSVHMDYEISPFAEVSIGNTPPVIRFAPDGPSAQGPRGISIERTAKVGSPLSLDVWVSDDAKFTSSSGSRPKTLGQPVSVKWIPYRSPGRVIFSEDRPTVTKEERSGSPAGAFNGKATTTATFMEPGDYVLNVTANDYSGEGGGGFQCCWTTAKVKVSVKP
jgi:hypothetical protein